MDFFSATTFGFMAPKGFTKNPESLDSLRRMFAGTGSDTLLLPVAALQDHAYSTKIDWTTDDVMSEEDVRACVAVARELGKKVILKAMAKNPDDRFQSIGEMMSELRLSQGFINTNGARPIISKGPYNFGTQKLQPIKEKDLPEDEPSGKEEEPFTRFMDSISNHSQKTIIIGMLGVFLVAFVWAFFSFGNFWSTEDITVPDVTGKQVEIAKKILKDKKLDVSVNGSGKRRSASRRSRSRLRPEGLCVKANRTIYLTVSKGNKGEEVLIPDLRSLTLDEAEKKLKEIGLSVGKVRYKESAQYADGTIIEQDPESPKKVEKGTKVDLVVCRKSEAEKEAEAAKNEAPNTSGMSLDAAVESLESSGLLRRQRIQPRFVEG